MKCRELSRLPKAQSLASIKFRRATPGSATALLYPFLPRSRFQIIDPSHPAARISRQALLRASPIYKCPSFTLCAFPKAALTKPEVVFPNPPHVPAHPNANSMSIISILGKKDISKSAVVRNKLKNRMKSALALVVTRGADVVNVNGKQKVTWDEDEAGYQRWLMKDWTYVFDPTLEVYRMPYTLLIPPVREALTKIKQDALRLEADWRTMPETAEKNMKNGAQRSRPPHIPASTDR